MSDEQLARGLHGRYYSDLPFEDFAGRVGLSGQPTAPTREVPDVHPAPMRPAEPQGIMGGLRQMVTGEGRREPGVGEISVPTFNPLMPADALARSITDPAGANLQAGFFLDSNERNRAAMIRRNMPAAEFRRDQYGNLQVRNGADRPWVYLNRPGLSGQDVQSFYNETVRALPSVVGGGLARTILTRMGLAGATQAGVTTASQEAGRAFGGEGAQGGDVLMHSLGAAGGQGAGDVIARMAPGVQNFVAGVLRRVEAGTAPRQGVRAGPVTQQEGSIEIPAPGPTISRMAGDAARQAEEAAAQSVQRNMPGETAEQQARAQRFYELADEFGVQGVRQGQATGAITQIAEEQRALRGGSGERPYTILRESEDETLRSLREAGRAVPVREQPPVAHDVGEAGRAVQSGLAARLEAMEAAKNALYDSAGPQLRAVQLAEDSPRGLLDDVSEALRYEGVLGPNQPLPNASAYPVTAQAVNMIRQRVPQQIAEVTTPRDGYVRLYYGANPVDAELVRETGSLDVGAPLFPTREAARRNGPVVMAVDVPPSSIGVEPSPTGAAFGVDEANAFRGVEDTLDDYLSSGRPLSAREPIMLGRTQAQDAIEGMRRAGTLYDWEAVRKGLNRIRGAAQGIDKDAIGRVMAAFDDWYERQAFDNIEALQAIQQARAANRQILDLFAGQDASDIGGRAVERVLDLTQSGEKVIDGLLGAQPGAVASALSAVQRIKRIVLNTDEARAAFRNGEAIPEELEALRQAVFFRIMEPLDRMFDPGSDTLIRRASVPAEQLTTNFRQALDRNGQEIMRELFTPEELARIGRLREFVGMLAPPPGSVNFSGTAYEGARMMRSAAARVAESLGGPIGLVLSVPMQVLENTYTNVFKANMARRALERYVPDRAGRLRAVPGAVAFEATNDGESQ